VIVLVLASALQLQSCALEPDDLRRWLAQENGAGRVAALVPDRQQSHELRVAAVRLLTEQGAVLALTDALALTPPEDRAGLVDALVPTLAGMLQGGVAEQQVRAKEIIFYVGGYAGPAEQQQLIQLVLRWATEDFPGRSRLGSNHLSKVLPALGSQVAVPLLRQLRNGTALQETSATLLALRSPEVERATAIVLEEKMRQSLPQAPLPLVNSLLAINSAKLTPLLIDVAANPQVDKGVRNGFLDHVLDCKGPAAGPGLARLLADTDLRWYAAGNLLELEKLDGVRRVLLSLPEQARYREQPEELFNNVDSFCEAVGRLQERREAVEQVLLEGLQSAAWPGKLTAMHCLGLLGSRAAAAELERASLYTRRIPGWKPADSTLGQVAQQALARVKER